MYLMLICCLIKKGMTRSLGFLVLVLLIASICEAAIFQPVSDSHRSAALEFFTPVDGYFKSLEDAYEALRTFEILGLGKNFDMSTSMCPLVVEKLKSSSASLKDLNLAWKSNRILECNIDSKIIKVVTSRLHAALGFAYSLVDYYYSIGSLLLMKGQASGSDTVLENADQIFRSIKALGQSDGRWHYSCNNYDSSTRAGGLALETLAGVVSLASIDVDQSLIGALKKDVVKLFDNLKIDDDGAMYFGGEVVYAHGYEGPLSTTSSVVRGLMAVVDVTSGKIGVSGEKILGLAKFFLGVGTPANPHDLFNQIDALALLDNNRVSIPLILSLPATVLSMTRNNQLKVRVSTVLGSSAPQHTVKIVQGISSGSKDAPMIENQDLKFDSDGGFHIMNSLTKDFDVGVYEFVFKIDLQDPSQSDIYATGGQSRVKIFVTGLIKVDNAEISVIDRDFSVETWKMLDLSADNFLSLSANHLQKLRLSFQLVSPLGKAFKPHQALLNLRHEQKVEHVFVVGSSGNKLEMTLDFLGLAKKSYYLSGKYDVQLIVGDAAMENSFIRSLGHVDLDLPEAPLSATPRPLPPMDPHSRFGPKAEITHIFRDPRSVKIGDFVIVADLDETGDAVLTALVFLPLVWFILQLYDMGVNFDYFPTSARYVILSKFYHISIGALLCFIFWVKLDLCGTVVVFILIGAFMEFAGGPLVLHLRLMRIAEAKSLAKRKKRYLKKLKKLAEKKQIVSVST